MVSGPKLEEFVDQLITTGGRSVHIELVSSLVKNTQTQRGIDQ